MDQPTAEQALMELEPLVGEWTVEAKWPDGESWPDGGNITFEWHASGAHLVERATIDLPERQTAFPSSDAMRLTGRISSCIPTSAALAVSTR